LICIKASIPTPGYDFGVMSKKSVTLDVREDLRRGREPFSKIMQAVAALKNGQDLILIAPFKPAPLFGVLRQQGFSHEAAQTDEGDWKVRFFKTSKDTGPEAQVPVETPPAFSKRMGAGSPAIEVDVRGLEPPEPLVKILEAVASLPAGAQLRALTDRRPMHLYVQLEERGFTGETAEQTDGSFVTYVRSR
jgi:uncharacterized protein (DUF2249 family)